MIVQGTTQLHLVIGDPVVQTKSPALYSGWCESAGIDAVFVPFQIARSNASAVFAALRDVPNLRGMVVTIPFKPLVAGFCKELTQRAQVAGVANVVRVMADGSWQGDALDGFGCVTALAARGIAISGARVQIVGAGGAGAAVAAALAEAGAAQMMITDINSQQAAGLAARLMQHYPQIRADVGFCVAGGVDIVVNASPSGMRAGDPLPLDTALLASRPAVIEMIMEPARTRFLELAEAKGCQVIPGREVLEGQFTETLRFFDLLNTQTT